MKIKMLVTLRRDDFSAALGEVVDVEPALAHELIQNEQAEPVDALQLPRATTRLSPRKKYIGAVADQSDVEAFARDDAAGAEGGE